MGRWKALPFGSWEAQDSQAARRHLSARNLLVLLQKGWFYIAICIHLFTESAELPHARHERKSWAHQTTGNNQISTLGLLYTVWYNPMKKPKKQREPIKDGWDWKVSKGVSWGTDLWNWRMNVDYVEKGQAAQAGHRLGKGEGYLFTSSPINYLGQVWNLFWGNSTCICKLIFPSHWQST